MVGSKVCGGLVTQLGEGRNMWQMSVQGDLLTAARHREVHSLFWAHTLVLFLDRGEEQGQGICSLKKKKLLCHVFECLACVYLCALLVCLVPAEARSWCHTPRTGVAEGCELQTRVLWKNS